MYSKNFDRTFQRIPLLGLLFYTILLQFAHAQKACTACVHNHALRLVTAKHSPSILASQSLGLGTTIVTWNDIELQLEHIFQATLVMAKVCCLPRGAFNYVSILYTVSGTVISHYCTRLALL